MVDPLVRSLVARLRILEKKVAKFEKNNVVMQSSRNGGESDDFVNGSKGQNGLREGPEFTWNVLVPCFVPHSKQTLEPDTFSTREVEKSDVPEIMKKVHFSKNIPVLLTQEAEPKRVETTPMLLWLPSRRDVFSIQSPLHDELTSEAALKLQTWWRQRRLEERLETALTIDNESAEETAYFFIGEDNEAACYTEEEQEETLVIQQGAAEIIQDRWRHYQSLRGCASLHIQSLMVTGFRMALTCPTYVGGARASSWNAEIEL